MKLKFYVIAKKYAIAFLNLYFDQIDDKEIENILDFAAFLKTNKYGYIFLRAPSISDFNKQKALVKIANKCGLSEPVKRIMVVLLAHGRIEILDKVLEQIVICYRERKDIKLFTVTTSHPLSEAEKKGIVTFVEGMAKGRVVAQFLIDTNLICGFRLQSKNFLWERSISKQLRDIKKSIFKQVGLW